MFNTEQTPNLMHNSWGEMARLERSFERSPSTLLKYSLAGDGTAATCALRHPQRLRPDRSAAQQLPLRRLCDRVRQLSSLLALAVPDPDPELEPAPDLELTLPSGRREPMPN